MIEDEINHMRSAWSDKDGKIERAIKTSRQEIKSLYKKFHHLIF